MANLESSNYWCNYVLAPNRKRNDYPVKLLFLIKEWEGNDTSELWERIKTLTEQDRLGYYSGISDDGEVIAIHAAINDENQLEEEDRIANELDKIGFVNYTCEDRENLLDF